MSRNFDKGAPPPSDVPQKSPLVTKEISTDKLWGILCGFREGYSTQLALIRMIEKWKKSLGKSGVVGSILMNLSKAYDCLPHDLLIAKLTAYGFDICSLCLVYEYLTNIHQRVKIASSKSYPQKIHVGARKGQF